MEYNVLGKSFPGLNYGHRADGSAEYVSDMHLKGMLYGKILRSPYAHARIVSIDTSEAEAMPGVKAVVTNADTPNIPFGTNCGRDDWLIMAKDVVRFVGDEVAGVAATSEEIAAEAVKKIKVVYEELPALLDYHKSLDEDSPRLYDDCPDNTVYKNLVEEGDVDAAFAKADLIVEDTFHTSQVYQAYMETKCAVCQWTDTDKLTMWLPVQVPMKCRLAYAKALGLPAGNVRVIKPVMGGGFGAKFEYMNHLICAVLAKKAGMPVKMINTRREDMEAGNPRVPMDIHIKLALDKEGHFLGKIVETLGSNGARTVYSPPIVGTTTYRIDALYQFGAVRSSSRSVYANTVPTGCFRGFGNSQMITTFEQLVDRAAAKLGINPMEIRLRNSYPNDKPSVNCHGWEIMTCGLIDCLKRVDEMSHFTENYGKPKGDGRYRRGFGLASTMHVSGNRAFFKPFDGSSSLIRIGEDGQITLVHGECDMGQGQDTAFAMIACEALGVPFEKISVATVDTQISGLGCGSFSTRGSTVGGQGVIAAARDAKKNLLEFVASMPEYCGRFDAHDLDIVNGKVLDPDGNVLMTFAEAANKCVYKKGGMPVTGVGYWVPPTSLPNHNYYGNASPVYPYGAHVAEVEVDTWTGDIRVVNYWAVHDVGKIINRTMLEGQLEGGIVQGIGWALTEDQLYDDKGNIRNANFLDYRIPGPRDVPHIYTDFVEPIDPRGPFGVKGIGEPSLNPVAAAVLNAVTDATGLTFNYMPVTAQNLLERMKKEA